MSLMGSGSEDGLTMERQCLRRRVVARQRGKRDLVTIQTAAIRRRYVPANADAVLLIDRDQPIIEQFVQVTPEKQRILHMVTFGRDVSLNVGGL
jgi:hypothetical protein